MIGMQQTSKNTADAMVAIRNNLITLLDDMISKKKKTESDTSAVPITQVRVRLTMCAFVSLRIYLFVCLFFVCMFVCFCFFDRLFFNCKWLVRWLVGGWLIESD
jgi:hypothetical protein